MFIAALFIIGNAKECSNYLTIVLISHTSKVMLKILQARLQQYMNHELPDVQAGFRKGRRTRDQIAKFEDLLDHQKCKRVPEKISISALLTMPKPLTIWITINCGKSERDWNTKQPDLSTDFSRGRSSSLVFPSLSEFSTVYCDPHSQRLWHSQ